MINKNRYPKPLIKSMILTWTISVIQPPGTSVRTHTSTHVYTHEYTCAQNIQLKQIYTDKETDGFLPELFIIMLVSK